jgi:hypothetical protein
MKTLTATVSLAFLLAVAPGLSAADKTTVNETMSLLIVKAEAPVPSEITDEMQAQNVARDAAETWGQTQILTYILKKKTKSGKILAVAETPSLELQKEIRDYVKSAKAEDVKYENKICRLNLVLPKGPLKAILKKN